MLNRSQLYNYLTFILAICTICSALFSIVNKLSPVVSIVLMCIMLIFRHISKKINEKEIIITEQSKIVLNNMKEKSEDK